MTLASHIDFLTAFAERHFTGDPSRDDMIRLKLEHSLRVLDNGERILDGEGIDGHTATLARLATLYHDTGRFPQLAIYGTFKDQDSVNHARLGVLTLRSLDLPCGIAPDDWRTIRLAVAQHNVKTIRDSLPEPAGLITKVVRDADKLDILKVMIEFFSGELNDPTITHGFKEIPGQYSDRIYDAVMAEEPGDYRDIKCANDFKLLIAGWIYDFNFASAISIASRRGLIERIFSFLPKDKKIQYLEEKINKFIHYNAA
ncbi:HD domain-containing protein [Pseudodesulfovibrio cashew]|nr:HD domain-containing protein [Pseudodesulfovibrio cashew]